MRRSDLFSVRGLVGWLWVSLALAAPVYVPAGAQAASTSLCELPDQSYFSCQTRNGKLIELCGGKTVAYRFESALNGGNRP